MNKESNVYDYLFSQGDLFAFADANIKIQEPATASPGLYSPTLPPTETAPEGEAPLAIVAPGKAAPRALPDAALVMPPPARTDWTVSDIRAAIASWDLKDKRCRDLLTAVAHAADILAFNPAKLAGRAPWSCAGLNRVLWARPHLAYGLSVTAFSNMVSNLRTVLIRLGLHADSRYGVNQLSPEWQVLYDAVPTLERRKGLVRFFRYLTLMGITPAMLEPQVINGFDTWCRIQILHHDPSGLSRRAASNWTFCREHVPGWPRVELHRAGMRDHYTLSWDAFPAPFTADVERYLAGLAAGPGLRKKLKNPFRELAEAEQKAPAVKSPRSIRRALKIRTIETRRYQIKLAATALVMSGEVPIERITSLATLVNPVENAATVLEFHEARQRAQRLERGEDVSEVFLKSSHLLGIAEALRQVGKYVAKLPEGEMAHLLEYLATVTPDQQLQMSQRNADRLNALFADRTYGALLHLPGTWVRKAGEANTPRLEAARMVMYAVALEIFLFLPLRRGNCISLKLDTHLRRPNPNGLIHEIHIPGHTVKNGADITWPVEPESAKLIETYLRVYRPLLAQPGNPYLFPGLGQSHRNESEFGSEFSRRVAQAIGVEFNCHLVRHFAVVRYLRKNPGAYETAAQILGHRNPDTTRRFYCGLEIDAAARHVNATLAEERHAIKRIAVGHYHLPARSRHGKPGAR